MSKSTITITPVTNIENSRVVDNDKVTTETWDSYDPHTFRNVPSDKTRKDTLIHVSLYDDVIVREKEEFKILHMLTKE